MLGEHQHDAPRQLQQLNVGDTVWAGGAEFKITAIEHRRRIVLLELEAPDGEHATLIGVPGTLLPF